jgi:ribosomal protein L40E
VPKGQKTCDKCGTSTGPRAFICKKCNTPFVFSVKSKESRTTKVIRDVDWRTLCKGDRIRVGGGPYYVNNQQEFVPMGYRGRFVVDSIDDKGVRAFGLDKFSGFCHIYMGPDYQNPETKVWKIKHKMLKLKPKVEQQ